MSSGKFSKVNYQDNSGGIRSLRCQPETLTATFAGVANAAPAGTLTAGLTPVSATAGRRSRGRLRARRVYFAWDTKPANYDGTSGYIVVPNPTVFDGVTIGAAVSYLGGSGTVTGKDAEKGI